MPGEKEKNNFLVFSSHYQQCYGDTYNTYDILSCFSYRDLLKSSPMILVGTTSGLVQVNARTMEICGFIDFQGKKLS